MINIIKKLKIHSKSDELALLGGNPTRLKEFRSKPYINNKEIRIVKKLMKEGTFQDL